MKEHIQLAKEINDFIEKYAIIKADYDPEYETPEERFNGPDSSMLSFAATMLELGKVPHPVHSDWGSGCYSMNLDDNGIIIHQDLNNRVYEIIQRGFI